MDFWSRLLSPLSSGSSRRDQAKDPAKRLHRFEKEYGHLLSTWRSASNLTRDGDAAETLEIRLQELTNILSDESRRPLPHPCIQYASIKQIYVPIGKIATTSNNEWIIKEAVLFFATLIESEEEAFVENSTFSASLTNLLVRITGVNSVRLGLDTESRVVELAFNITTKIRLEPKVLPAWFKNGREGDRKREGRDKFGQREDRDKFGQREDGDVGQDRNKFGTQREDSNVVGQREDRSKFAGRTQRAEFPLFYILMDYIHHEGKIGDFARTGLLYIIEAASNSASLEQWIVESDLSTLMATGLGALYSQLSRKLVIDHLPHNLPPILAFSDYEHPTSNYEVISSCSPEFQSHLETFLSHLLFWQDVLNHCSSVDVKSTLLEHFQVIFLQQLLYPSLLESSDIDGGSSVAVLTYLRRILESLDHPDMINLILHYLLALPNSLPSDGSPSKSLVTAARKRKSMDLATMIAERSEPTATPLLFNLVDLILACLRSRNQQTIFVTLQLVSAILKRHHRYAVLTLLRTDSPSNKIHRTVGAHDQEIEYIMYLAGSIGGQSNFDEVYETVLKDTMTRLETHPCSVKLVAPKVPIGGQRAPAIPDSLPGAPKDVGDHTLQPDDPLLNALLDLLETFFLNSVETNLSVTETLVDLGVCGYMRIEGWLSRDPENYVYDEVATEEIKDGDDDDPRVVEERRTRALKRCQQRPKWSSTPRVLGILKRLEEQVLEYKRTVPRFDDLVQQRREAFQTADAMLNHSFTYRPVHTPDSRSASPTRNTLEGLAQRLLSELGTPSRPSSRGRKRTISGPPVPPKMSQAREESVANQLAAFAAIDQTILAKRVGVPKRGGEAGGGGGVVEAGGAVEAPVHASEAAVDTVNAVDANVETGPIDAHADANVDEADDTVDAGAIGHDVGADDDGTVDADTNTVDAPVDATADAPVDAPVSDIDETIDAADELVKAADEPIKAIEVVAATEATEATDEVAKAADEHIDATESIKASNEAAENTDEPIKATNAEKPTDVPARAVNEPTKAVDAAVDDIDESVKVADEPVDAADEPAKTADEHVKAVDEVVKAADEPADTADEPVDTADELVQATSEPVKTADEPAKTVDEVVEATDEPAKVANQFVDATDATDEPAGATEGPIEAVDEAFDTTDATDATDATDEPRAAHEVVDAVDAAKEVVNTAEEPIDAIEHTKASHQVVEAANASAKAIDGEQPADVDHPAVDVNDADEPHTDDPAQSSDGLTDSRTKTKVTEADAEDQPKVVDGPENEARFAGPVDQPEGHKGISKNKERAPGDDTRDADADPEPTVSVSHVVTNVIVLQSFLFELASLIQVRAGLFDEIRFM